MVKEPRFFRDFTWANKLLMGLSLLLLGQVAASKLAYRSWQRQYWGVSVCSQQESALTLLAGSLVLADGSYRPLDEDLMKVDDQNPLCASCEQFYPSTYSESSSFLLPPDSLRLEWASLPERRFYRGAFCLPKARIDSVFAHYQAHPDTTWRFAREPREYDPNGGAPRTESGLMLAVRLGAGGRVSVSVLLTTPSPQGGIDFQWKELAHFQAVAYQPAWRDEAAYDFYFHARTPRVFLDSLAGRIDSAGYFRVRRWQPATP